eukprot:gene10971-12204_t
MTTRAVVKKLSNAIHHNAMTNLQGWWGGSHDVILGMLLWMYQIPSFALGSAYYGTPIKILPGKHNLVLLQDRLRNSSFFIFHRVMSRKLYRWHQKKPILYDMVSSQYDISHLLGDDLLYNNDSLHEVNFYEIVYHQVRLGEIAAVSHIKRLPASGVMNTNFAHLAQRLNESYHDFTPAYCSLLIPS